MNKKTKFIFMLVCISCISAGCSSFQIINGKNAAWRKKPFQAELPIGWIRFTMTNAPFSGKIMLDMTKDGGLIQKIMMTKIDIKKELPLTKKKLTTDMLSSELAEAIINESKLNKDLLNFAIVENAPVEIDGQDAFRIVFTFRNKAFVRYKGILYGFVMGRFYYQLRFLAIQQHFYERDVSTFEDLVRSLKIVEK